MSAIALLAFSSERAATNTLAFLEYETRATSLTTPVLEPVTMYTWTSGVNLGQS